MKWAFIRSFLRTESFFGIVAVVIAVSNAPVFQNVGLDPDGTERLLLVSYYIALIFALLALFLGRVLFELYCPEVIKKAATLQQYLDATPDETDEDGQIRGEMTAEWKTANQQERGRLLTTTALTVFLLLFPLSFCLAALTLVQFGRAPDQDPKGHLLVDIHIERAQGCEGRPAGPQHLPHRQCPSRRPLLRPAQ